MPEPYMGICFQVQLHLKQQKSMLFICKSYLIARQVERTCFESCYRIEKHRKHRKTPKLNSKG